MIKIKFDNNTLFLTENINYIAGNSSSGKSYLIDNIINKENIEIIYNDNSRYIIESKEKEILYISGTLQEKLMKDSRYKSLREMQLQRFTKEEIKNAKIIIFDDYDEYIDIRITLDIAQLNNLIVFILDRKTKIKNIKCKNFKAIDNSTFLIEDYLTLEDIFRVNQNKDLTGIFKILKTEDKFCEDKIDSGYNYWKRNKKIIESYYNCKIIKVEGSDGIQAVFKELKEYENEKYLLCLDFAWDNIQVLRRIINILEILSKENNNSIIISTFTYEQLIILNNLDIIAKIDKILAESLRDCILNQKDISSLHYKLLKHLSEENHNSALRLDVTQEHKYKSVLRSIQGILKYHNLELDRFKCDLKYLYNTTEKPIETNNVNTINNKIEILTNHFNSK